MDTISVNARQTASSASASQLRLSVLPNAQSTSESITLSPLTSLLITGSLPGGKQLTRPLRVRFAYDDGEVIVNEPRFHIHAVGATRAEALAAFRHLLSEELDDLTADEEELGPRLKAELQYLRDLIRTVE